MTLGYFTFSSPPERAASPIVLHERPRKRSELMKNPDPTDKDKASPIGARNDDSSLFSLDSLKVKQHEGALDQPAQQAPRKPEESGLIDLKALAEMQRAEKSAALEVAAVV